MGLLWASAFCIPLLGTVLGGALPNRDLSPSPILVFGGYSYRNGTPSAGFYIKDPTSSINEANCAIPSSGASGQPPFPLNVEQPCSPASYQWTITQWNSFADFSVQISHTVKDASGQTEVYNGDHHVQCLGDIPCTPVDVLVVASSVPAPPGWSGDPINTPSPVTRYTLAPPYWFTKAPPDWSTKSASPVNAPSASEDHLLGFPTPTG